MKFKKLLFCSIIVILQPCNSFSQEFSLGVQTDTKIPIDFALTEVPFEHTEIDGQIYIDFTKSHDVTLMNAGAPALPVFTESVIVPAQGKISLGIKYGDFVEYENVLVAPSKGSLKRNVNPADVPYEFGPAYSPAPYAPGFWGASFTDPFILRKTRGVTIQICPYNYNPVTKTLKVYHTIHVDVLVDEAQIGINELPENSNCNDGFSNVYRNFYLNANSKLGKYAPVEELGEMLIIANDALLDEIDPLVVWKNQKGIKTTAVGTSTAGIVDTDIKAYIQSYYGTNPNLLYVLLVGDHGQIPAHTYGLSGAEQLWSDSYYGQLSGGTSDFYPELFVGRFSSAVGTDIATMVERTLEYETNPLAGDWMTKGIGLASDEGAGIGDDGEPDWQHARNNRTKYLAYGYTTVHEFYDASHGGSDAAGNPSSAMIATEVNSGVGMFNYTGHGNLTTCVTGNFDTGDVDACTNNGMYPYVISVACNNGTFVGGTCLSEVWLTATNAGSPAGAIAAAGSSILMAWAEPMQTQDEMSDIITEAYPSNYKTTLGGLLYNAQMSTLETYSESTTAEEVMQTWILFGDPSVEYRNRPTMDLTISHVDSVLLGETTISVDCAVEGTLIGISKANAYQGYGVISGGTTSITIPAVDSFEPLMVTATKQNYRPFQDSIFVIDAQVSAMEIKGSKLKIWPNPVNEMLNISWGVEVDGASISLVDVTGKVVYQSSVTGVGCSLLVADFSAGMYVLNVSSNGKTYQRKVAVE